MTKLVSIAIFLLLSVSIDAQVFQTRRLEIPIDREIQSYQVTSLDTSGILTYRRFSGPKGDQLELTRLDTTFLEIWKGFLPVERGYALMSIKPFGNKAFLLLRLMAGKPDYRVIAMNVANGTYTQYEIKNLIPFNPSEFVIVRNALLIAGYFNYRPIVLHYSLLSQKSRILPGFVNEPGEINQIYATPDGNFDVIVSSKKDKKKSLWIRSFDKEGDLVKTVVLEPSEHKSLIFGRIAKINNDTSVIAGVYGRNMEYSRGVFIAEINAYGEYIIHYYNFADLKNFFHYMKARKEKRIKERIERRRVRGKKIRFNYRFLVHQLIPYQDKFVMLGEAFIPRYATRRTTFNSIPYNYSPYSYAPSSRYYATPYRSDLVFDGFEYTHAVVLGIDAKGKLAWDNSFQINDIRTYQLEQFVKIVTKNNHVELLYLFENIIRSKEITGNEIVEGGTQSLIKVNEGDQLLKINTGISRLEYWYKQTLFVSGTQTVITPGQNPRLVFFINKLEVK